VAGSATGGGVDQPVDPDRDALLAVLIRHGVAFVLIGGAAIQSYGGAYDTQDIDLAPEVGEANLQRLCNALNELECRLVTDLANTAAWTLPDDYFTPRSIRGAERLEPRHPLRPARRDIRSLGISDRLHRAAQARRPSAGRRDVGDGPRRGA
jgi:hypothetical protein